MDFQRAWRVIVAFRWLIVLVSLSALITSTVLTYVLSEKYDATAVVLVRPQERIALRTHGSGNEILDYPVSQLAPINAPIWSAAAIYPVEQRWRGSLSRRWAASS